MSCIPKSQEVLVCLCKENNTHWGLLDKLTENEKSLGSGEILWSLKWSGTHCVHWQLTKCECGESFFRFDASEEDWRVSQIVPTLLPWVIDWVRSHPWLKHTEWSTHVLPSTWLCSHEWPADFSPARLEESQLSSLNPMASVLPVLIQSRKGFVTVNPGPWRIATVFKMLCYTLHGHGDLS